jgi:hypothetical protein
MRPVYVQQHFFDCLPRLYGVLPYPKAIAELPRFLVKVRAAPPKSFDRTITQYDEVSITIVWHPSVTYSWDFQRSFLHGCIIPCIKDFLILVLL